MRTLVVDTDVVSFIFNRHALSAPYLDLVAGNELVISFMTLAELRLGVLQANWVLGGERSSTNTWTTTAFISPTSLRATPGPG